MLGFHCVNRVSPIFCNNHVVHHKPHLIAKQFGCGDFKFEKVFDFMEYTLQTKDNSGASCHRYRKIYLKELQLQDDCKCLDDYFSIGNLKSQLRVSQHYCHATKGLDSKNHEDTNISEMTNKNKRSRQRTSKILRYYQLIIILFLCFLILRNQNILLFPLFFYCPLLQENT